MINEPTRNDFLRLQGVRMGLKGSTMKTWLGRFRRVDRSKQVPGLRGISNDGTTVYIDRAMPRTLGAILLDPLFAAYTTVRHGLTMGARVDQKTASGLAAAAEHQLLTHIAPGVSWTEYQILLHPYERELEPEEVEDPPPDLALYPYSGPLYKTLWEFQQGKVPKSAVAYRKGSPAEHCGNCSMFRPHSHSCTLVIGLISPRYVCDEWEKKGAQADSRTPVGQADAPA